MTQFNEPASGLVCVRARYACVHVVFGVRWMCACVRAGGRRARLLGWMGRGGVGRGGWVGGRRGCSAHCDCGIPTWQVTREPSLRACARVFKRARAYIREEGHVTAGEEAKQGGRRETTTWESTKPALYGPDPSFIQHFREYILHSSAEYDHFIDFAPHTGCNVQLSCRLSCGPACPCSFCHDLCGSSGS